METGENIISTLLSVSPPNIIFTTIIILLVFADLLLKRDLKGQIVSVGVLGTFVGIFLGLQDFDPNNMKDSVNGVLLGLKTAFATSILGMGSAIALSIYQKIRDRISDDSKSEEEIFAEINHKLDNLENLSFLPRLDNTMLIHKLEAIAKDIKEGGSGGGKDSSKELNGIFQILIEIKNNQTRNSQNLETHFENINESMNLAIQELSKGATEEITEALKKVIEDFNSNLTAQFGGNFVQLNEAVYKLVEWQDSYKEHVEGMEQRLEISTSSVEKAKNSIVAISEANEKVNEVYEKLSKIISTYGGQTENLSENLEALHKFAPNVGELVQNMETTFKDFSTTYKEFIRIGVENNNLQKDVIIKNGEEITKFITESSDEVAQKVDDSVKSIEGNFSNALQSLERQKYEINVVSSHFRTLAEQVPEALRVSLNELNNALSTLTTKFQKDYEEVLYQYRDSYRDIMQN
ncbi:biopolymer transport protein [Thiovulum sp. ES]|nr:biopolymer transport protein [Thiovulum sp. ES]